MKPASSVLLAALLAACSSAKAPQTTDAPPAITPDAMPVSAADLPKRIAASVCGALFRCCDDDLDTYFGAYAANELLKEFKPRLPPANEASCRSVMEEMLAIVPVGDWVRAVGTGTADYHPAVAASCLAALDTAACGKPARDALWDSKCFGFAPPSGGTEQRTWVTRGRAVGETCGPIRDGVGAAFYGTCDPTTAFCCYSEPGRTGCQYPFDAQNHPRTGTCSAVAAVGAACSIGAPVKLCGTGIDCDADSLKCVGEVQAQLASGQPCIDAGYHSLGTCQSSFCDVLGTKRCEPMHADGAACGGGDECSSGLCRMQVCRPMDICTGMAPPPPPPPIDAGVDASPDASPDASVDASVMTSNETCVAAPTLASASVASPLAGYASRITAPFGTTNDYNPYNPMSLSPPPLPPGCSIVYDAKGKDVVYAVTLAPGERLKLRAELADGKRAGIYLLDTCPGGSWPDFDDSKACGNTEYAVGTFNPTGYDPATLTITYPMTLGGQPTQPFTFWVVVDEVGGDTSTGFTLDWQLIH